MSNNAHNELVSALCKRGEDILNELTPLDAHLMHMVVGIAGEAGEILDAIKRKTIYRKPLDRENVIEELGDIEFYLEGLRQGLGLTREECLEQNIAKLTKRYPNAKYSNADTLARADKEERGI